MLTLSSFDCADFVFDRGYSHHAREKYEDYDMFVDVPGHDLEIYRWTTVPMDNRLMNHLLTLFWTWDTIVERLLYRPIFEEDLTKLDPLDTDVRIRRFCSPFLVNALLALSCVCYYSPFPR
jgi:hypothetical protein